MQNTVVQSVDLQGNRWGTGMSRQNSRANGISKFAGAAPLMTVQLTDNTGVAQVKDVLKWCFQLKWCLCRDITIVGAPPPCQGVYSIK